MEEILHIDGSHGEGGGQLVRMSVALAGLTGRSIRVTNIRGRRPKPRLHAQHSMAVRGVSELCGGRLQGGERGSQELEFHPGEIKGGEYHFDVGTAGSVTLVLQACLPVSLAAKMPTRLVITGGTDIPVSPPVDYVRHVFLRLLGFLGARVSFRVARRGYFPRGEGSIEVEVEPVTSWKGLWLPQSEPIQRVAGVSHVSRIRADIATRMSVAALIRILTELPELPRPPALEEEVIEADAAGPGGGITLWAEGLPRPDGRRVILGANNFAKRGRRAERIGDGAARALVGEVLSGATVDVRAADQLMVYLAQAAEPSAFLVREATGHLTTMAWLLPQFLPVEIAAEPVVPEWTGRDRTGQVEGRLVRVSVRRTA